MKMENINEIKAAVSETGTVIRGLEYFKVTGPSRFDARNKSRELYVLKQCYRAVAGCLLHQGTSYRDWKYLRQQRYAGLLLEHLKTLNDMTVTINWIGEWPGHGTDYDGGSVLSRYNTLRTTWGTSAGRIMSAICDSIQAASTDSWWKALWTAVGNGIRGCTKNYYRIYYVPLLYIGICDSLAGHENIDDETGAAWSLFEDYVDMCNENDMEVDYVY